MTSYLRRLLRTGAAYQLADAVSKVVALALLPIYTNHLTPADYGTAELMLTTIILVSIVLRLGLGEALVRFHFDDADPERRRAIARTATGTLFAATTVAAIVVALLAGPISSALLEADRPGGDPRRRARPVGLHEPRARLRPPARGGAGPRLRDRLADQRRPHGRADGLSRGHPRRGRGRPPAGQLHRLRRGPDRPVDRRARRVRLPAGRHRPRAPGLDAALRPADRARRGQRLRALLHRPLLALPLRERRARPASTRSASSSPASSCSRSARSSTPGRRSPTASRTTRRRAASTPASRPTTCSSPASWSPASSCSAAGSCGSSPPPSSSQPTRRCRG